MKNTCNINCENGHCNGVINASYEVDQLEIQMRTPSGWYDVKMNITGTDGVVRTLEPKLIVTNTFYFDIPFEYYQNTGTMRINVFGMKTEKSAVEVEDDQQGHLSITSDAITFVDDDGNATMTSDYLFDDHEGNILFDFTIEISVESNPYQFIVIEKLQDNNIVEFIDGVYYIKNVSPLGTFIILISPSGLEYKVMVNDNGELYTERKGE